MRARKLVFGAAVAAIAALAMASCGNGAGDPGGGGGAVGVWETVFVLSTDEYIQAIPHGEIYFGAGLPGFGSALISRRGEDAHLTISAVPNPGAPDNSIQVVTAADWGVGIMMRNEDFDFQVGDTILISGEIVTLGTGGGASGPRLQVNRRVGAEDAIYGLIRTEAGAFTMNHVLTEADVTNLRISVDYPGLALEARAIGMTVRIDEIHIEGYRGIPVWEIELDVANDPHYFADLEEGYAQDDADNLALEVTVANIGNMETGALAIALTGANPTAFALSAGSLPTIEPGDDATFEIQPAFDLSHGTYTATVTVSGAHGISASFAVSLTVNAAGAAQLDTPAVGISAGIASWTAIDDAETYRVYAGETLVYTVTAPAVQIDLGTLGLRAFPASTYHSITVVAASANPLHLDSDASLPQNFAPTAPTLTGDEVFTLAHFLGSNVGLGGALNVTAGLSAANAPIDAFGVLEARNRTANGHGFLVNAGWNLAANFYSITVTGRAVGDVPADARMELRTSEFGMLDGAANANVTAAAREFTITAPVSATGIRIMTNDAGQAMSFAIESIVVTRGDALPTLTPVFTLAEWLTGNAAIAAPFSARGGAVLSIEDANRIRVTETANGMDGVHIALGAGGLAVQAGDVVSVTISAVTAHESAIHRRDEGWNRIGANPSMAASASRTVEFTIVAAGADPAPGDGALTALVTDAMFTIRSNNDFGTFDITALTVSRPD